MKTQNEMIKNWLLSGKTLTPIDALNLFGCFRLSARIFDLHKEGLPIKTRMKLTTTNKHIAEYYIEQS